MNEENGHEKQRERGKKQKRSTRHAGLPVRDHAGWRIRWTDASGKRRSMGFPADSYKKAVAELERIKGEVRAVKDGRAPRPVTPPTFAEFWDGYYRPNRTDQKRSPKDDLSIYKAHLKAAFGDLPLNQITTARVSAFRAELHRAELRANTIRNILALLGGILRYAQAQNFLFALPKIEQPKTHIETFNYLRTEKEIAAFLKAAREASQTAEEKARKEKRPVVGIEAYPLFAAAIYTGMRAGELFGLRWTDVDLGRGLITVQRSFDKPTKSGKPRHVPIMHALTPILKEWRLKNQNDLVFPNDAGNMHTPSPRVVEETYPEVLKNAKLPRLRFHDLRHTFASHWVLKGGDLFRLQKILGHSTQVMTQRYAHLAPDAFEKFRGIFKKPRKTGPAKVSDISEARGKRGRAPRAK
jgi:integrase